MHIWHCLVVGRLKVENLRVYWLMRDRSARKPTEILWKTYEPLSRVIRAAWGRQWWRFQ